MAEMVLTPSIVREVGEKLALSRASFLDSFAGVPASAMEGSGVTGTWSLKQHIGQVAFWDRWEAADLSDRVAGKSSAAVGWQVENDRHVPESATRPLDSVIDGLHRDHDAFVTQLRELDPNDIRTADLAKYVRSSTTSHYVEHGAEIRA
jgi:Mycothiol maleylpyruvate isomerase N-terminal domain